MKGSSARGSTLTLRNFAGGLDRRDGLFTENQNRFRDLVNYRISNAKRLVRRPPLKLTSGLMDNATTQGLFEIKGVLYTLAKRGDTVASTLSGVTVDALRFDNPDYCTTWQLIQGVVFNGVLCALIRHTYPGTTVTSVIKLHVLDGKKNKPTYVEDPACPTNWSPSLPMHLYRQGTAGAFTDYTPRMAVAGGRLWISRPDGNVAFCRTSNARTWNTRTVDDVITGGEWYYYTAPAAASGPLFTFVVSEAVADLTVVGKWSCYVLEWLDSTGTWQKFTEVDFLPFADQTYQAASVASRFAGGPNEIQLKVYWTGAADTIFRFRLIAGPPPVTIVSGLKSAFYDTEYFVGDGVVTAFQTARFQNIASFLNAPTLAQYQVFVNGVLKTGGGVDYTASYTVPTGATLSTLHIAFTAAPALAASIAIVNPKPITYDGTTPYPHIQSAGTSNKTLAGKATYEGQLMTLTSKYMNGAGLPSFVAGGSISIGIGLRNAIAAGISVVSEVDTLVYDTAAGAYPSGSGQNRYQGLLTWVVSAQESYTAARTVTAFTYGSQAGSESAFFLDRKLSYQLDVAGFNDAGFLPTAAQGVASQTVTALAALKDRLLVFYRSGSEAWYVPAVPTDHALQDTGTFGTGQQTSPAPVKVAGSILCGMSRGIRSVSLGGLGFDQERDENIGEPVVDLGVPLQQAATYWPWLGEFVTACTIGGVFQFLVLDYSPEEKITAWSTWTAAGITAVDTFAMHAVDDRLFMRSGAQLYYFDASAVIGTVGAFRDSNDPPAPGLAYESEAAWMLNDFQAPGKTKNVIGMDLIQTGRCTLAHRYIAHDETVETDPVPVTDSTVARGYIPCAVWGTGIAPVIRSTDDSGHELQEVSMRFLVRMR